MCLDHGECTIGGAGGTVGEVVHAGEKAEGHVRVTASSVRKPVYLVEPVARREATITVRT